MKLVLGLFAALPLALASSPAYPCGDSGGGSSGGGSSGGSSSGGGSSSSSSSSEPACVEVSSVVGRSECSHFGAWRVGRRPRMQISMGSTFHSFSMRGMSFDGNAAHGDGIAYRMVGEQVTGGHGASAATFDLRVTTMLGKHLYVGGETRIGKAMVGNARLDLPNQLEVDPTGSLFVTAGALAGIQVPMGDWNLKAETLAGPRVVNLTVHSSHMDCEDTSFVGAADFIVEPRVVVDKWLSPWLSAGASVGSNALKRGDYTFGVFMQGHLRAFDGGR